MGLDTWCFGIVDFLVSTDITHAHYPLSRNLCCYGRDDFHVIPQVLLSFSSLLNGIFHLLSCHVTHFRQVQTSWVFSSRVRGEKMSGPSVRGEMMPGPRVRGEKMSGPSVRGEVMSGLVSEGR